MAGYYSGSLSPLTDLTRKGASDPVQWTEQYQTAFEKVKKALCGELLLFTPNFEVPFGFQADASNSGLGAVLSHGVDRLVLYLSRKLVEQEESTVEKECLTIKWAVGTLRYYLLGRAFTLCSDHAPLRWLYRMKDTNLRIARWYLALQPYNFKVVHKPWTQMFMADFLSRLPEQGLVGGSGLMAGTLPGQAVGICGIRGGMVYNGAWFSTGAL